MAQTTVAINLEAKTKGTESVKSLRTQMREAIQDAAAMSEKFGEFSFEALQAQKRVAEVRDKMDDLNGAIKALHPDKFNRMATIGQGIANGFQAAQGAMALFGGESEDVQKALLKVQGAMAFAQGMEGLDEAAKQFKTLGQDAVAAFSKMTTASKAFLATGLGLIISAIAYVVANFDELAESLGFAESEMSKMNKAMNMAAAETKIQADELNFYNGVVQDTTKSEGEREFALQKLKEAGIATDDVNVANANSLGKLNDRVKQQILLIAQRARAEAAAQILQEKTKKLIEMQNGDLDEATGWWDKFYAGSKAALMGTQAGMEELTKRGSNNIKEAQKDVTDAVKVHQIELEKATKLEGVNKSQQDKVTSTLKLRTEAQKNADKAAQESAAKQAELQKRSAELLAQEELVGKTEVEKAKILAQRKFKASTEGFKQGSKEYLAAQKIFNEEVAKIDADAAEKQKAADDKAVQERKQKEKEDFDNALKTIDTQFKIRMAKEGETDALQIQKLEAQRAKIVELKGLESEELANIDLELAKKRKEIYDKDVENKKKAEEQKKAAEEATIKLAADGFAIIADLADAFAGKSEAQQRKAFEIKKKASMAQAVIETIQAAQSAYASQMAIATPDAPIRAAVAAGVALAAGIARVRKIEQTPFEAKGLDTGGNGGGGKTPPAPSFAPTAGGTLPDEQQFGGMGRVYVLEGDITKTQTRVRRLRNTSVV